MTEWLQLSDMDRLLSLQQASVRSGIGAKAIEKDWWVTLALKAIFQTSYAKHILFKGGTSLKTNAGNLIERLSGCRLINRKRGFGFRGKPEQKPGENIKEGSRRFHEHSFNGRDRKTIIAIGRARGNGCRHLRPNT